MRVGDGGCFVGAGPVLIQAVIREMAIISAITPIVIPNAEMKVITDTKACFLLAVRYRLAMKNS